MDKNSYEKAGVSLEAGYESVERIKKHIKKTKNKGVASNIGSFGGMFDINKYNYKYPILVSGTDGVGTKLEIAKLLNIYDTIGIDLVAMCVNDIVAQGGKPLFFLDYIAVEKNIPENIEKIVFGICQGLQSCDCALIGGETAELPGIYPKGGFDLAGFVTGIVEKDEIIDGRFVKEDDLIIGLPSSGVHSNGYSLVRKIIDNNNLNYNEIYEELNVNKTLGEILLEPTKIYVNEVLGLLEEVKVNGIAHITGGGFYENVPRALNGLGFSIQKESFKQPNIFKFLKKYGGLEEEEMFNYFNMGIGMVLVISKEDEEKCLNYFNKNNLEAYVIGKIIKKGGYIK